MVFSTETPLFLEWRVILATEQIVQSEATPRQLNCVSGRYVILGHTNISQHITETALGRYDTSNFDSHYLVFSCYVEEQSLDGVFVIFTLVEHRDSSCVDVHILDELHAMAHAVHNPITWSS